MTSRGRITAASFAVIVSGALAVPAADAQIRTDGTLGPPASLTGPNFLIGQALGKLSGNNLFQSFAVFNVGSGESATFVTTTPGLERVISRVTGGSASTINGLVRLSATDATPDFIFINPAGVVFGNGARIDVPAAFRVSTADYVKFPDGNFYADPARTSTLSSAPPQAFGFLGTSRATVAVNDGASLRTSSLDASQPITLVGGDVSIDNGAIQTGGGEIRVVAAGSGAREVSWTGPLADGNGDIAVLHGGYLFSVAEDARAAGDILVSGGNITLDGSATTTFTGIVSASASNAPGPSGRVVVNASGDLVVRHDAAIATESNGNARSGDVQVSAASLSIIDGALIGTDVNGAGDAGAVVVKARDIVIDGMANADAATGIVSLAHGGTTGRAGNVDVTAERTLVIRNGGEIAADTRGAGRGGDVTVHAGDLTIDGQDIEPFTGISSDAIAGSGAGGNVGIDVAGNVTVIGGGVIAADTFASGAAGRVSVTAASLTVDGGGSDQTIISSTAYRASGNAGGVDVNVSGLLSLQNGGSISSDTSGAGRAGAVTIRAGDIMIDNQRAKATTGITSDANGGTGSANMVDVSATGTLTIVNGGLISSNARASGNAGTVEVSADSIYIAGDSGIRASSFAGANAGNITVSATDIVVDGENRPQSTGIASDARGRTGHGGNVSVTATGTLSVINAAVIDASTLSSGDGGNVNVTAGTLNVMNGGEISSSVASTGNGGSVNVSAHDILLDGMQATKATSIASEALAGTGNAGDVNVTATGTLKIVNGAYIDSSTITPGNAGAIKISAGTLALDDGIVSSSSFSAGNAGTVEVNAGKISIVNHGLIGTSSFESGHAGGITVNAGDIVIDSGRTGLLTGIVSESGDGSGNAGRVNVTATGNLALANSATISSDTHTQGNAGGVTVAAGTLTMATSSIITSSTSSSGNAGTVDVTARNVTIVGDATDNLTGISSQAERGSTGNAGSVEVNVADTLSVSQVGGAISSSTFGRGSAGSVRVVAGNVNGDALAFIGAGATADSSGQTGTVLVQANNALSLTNGAVISIQNEATVAHPETIAPTLLTVSAPVINLGSNAQITAASLGNVAASSIDVAFGPQLFITGATIGTAAQDGNGGSIAVRGSGLLLMQNGQITTSVVGTNGNGGDIRIAAPILVMQTGFIQANTAAAAAVGGNVTIDVGTLMPSGSTLLVGGSTPYRFEPGVFGFNVIQAAAPTGLSGSINISTPALDITGSLATLPAKFLDAGGLGRSPCAIVGGSSLSHVGRGGFAMRFSGALWMDAIDGPQTLGEDGTPAPSLAATSILAPCGPGG